MPNYVKNILVFEGIAPERFSEIKAEVFNEYGEFDFNKLIPMPESLNMLSGSLAEEAIVSYVTDFGRSEPTDESIALLVGTLGTWAKEPFDRAVKIFEEKPEIETELFNFSATGSKEETRFMTLKDAGAQYVDNYQKYGCTTWYDWCWDNWGTKWNAGDTSIEVNGLAKYEAISFETAWSCPTPIIRALSEKYPDIQLTCLYADEDYGSNCGIIFAYGSNNTFEEISCEGDTEFAIKIWEEKAKALICYVEPIKPVKGLLEMAESAIEISQSAEEQDLDALDNPVKVDIDR